jgi:hypothetical protein
MCPGSGNGNIERVTRVVRAFWRVTRSVRWRDVSVGAFQVLVATALVLIITAGLFAGILGVLTMLAFNR